MGLRALFGALLLIAFAAQAEDDLTLAAWRAWIADTGATEGAIVVLHNGSQVLADAHGMGLEAPVPVHSISKTITGACVMALVDDGLLSLDAQVGDVLDGTDLIAPDALAADVTVAELLTHTGGITPDQTQDPMRVLIRPASLTDDAVARAALSRPPGPRGTYAYNNENYAVLGAMIAAVTGQPVQDVCRAQVLDRLTSARIDVDAGGGSYGGWVMSVPDLARFAHGLTMADGAPRSPVEDGVEYGPGVLIRETAAGPNLWHYGALCLWGLRDSGAVFFSLPQGVTVAVGYGTCPSHGQLRALEQDVLVTAIHSLELQKE